ncbi:MAG: hypothetical protein GX282_02825, partial [Campylobacteraceae bacterium]|nr:hypothetical protein [Campylobacteraceae bacterium]
MILEFKFNYINKTNLLAYFLDFYAKKSKLPYSIYKENDVISLFVEGKEEELLKFSDEWMILIPNSVFLTKSEVLVVDEMKESNLEIPSLKLPNLTPNVVKNYVNHSDSLENECGIFSEISVLLDGEFVEVNETNYKELIKTLVLNLTHNQAVVLKDKNGEFILKNGLEFDSDFVMPTSFKSVEKAFIMDEKSYIALSSYEKPVLNLKLNAIFRQNNKNVPAFFDVKAASDFFVFALLDALYGESVN